MEWEGLLNNSGWRSSMVNWAIDAKAGGGANPKIEPLTLDPTSAARLGLDYIAIARKKGIRLDTPSLQLEFNRQNSHEKSKEYEAALMIVAHEMFFRELMMLNNIRFQKLMDALFGYYGTDDDSDFRRARATAVRLRVEEEAAAIEADNQSRLLKKDYTETPEFTERFNALMAEKKEWLDACDRADDAWGDSVFPPDSDGNPSEARKRFDEMNTNLKRKRLKNAESFSRQRAIMENDIRNASPEGQRILAPHLEKLKEAEEEHKAQAIRAQLPNLEKRALVNVPQMTPLVRYKELLKMEQSGTEMSAVEKEELNALKKDPEVERLLNRVMVVNTLHQDFAANKIEKVQKDFRDDLALIHAKMNLQKAKPEKPTNTSSIWQARNNLMKAQDLRQKKSKLIGNVQQALNDAEERSRKESPMKSESPEVNAHLHSVYEIIDDEDRSTDEVLKKLQEKLDVIAGDDAVPDKMRAVAQVYSEQIGAIATPEEPVKPVVAAQPAATNEKREEIKGSNFEAKQPSHSANDAQNRHPASEEWLDEMSTSSLKRTFLKITENSKVPKNIRDDFTQLQSAIALYKDDQSLQNAVSLKACYKKIDWDALEARNDAFSNDVMDLKELIETDNFMDRIPSAEDQDHDATHLPSQSM